MLMTTLRDPIADSPIDDSEHQLTSSGAYTQPGNIKTGIIVMALAVIVNVRQEHSSPKPNRLADSALEERLHS